jgi:hypothetical protein
VWNIVYAKHCVELLLYLFCILKIIKYVLNIQFGTIPHTDMVEELRDLFQVVLVLVKLNKSNNFQIG